MGRGVTWEVLLFRGVETVEIKHLGKVGAQEELGKETFPAAPWWWLLCRGGTGTGWGVCCQKIKCLKPSLASPLLLFSSLGISFFQVA